VAERDPSWSPDGKKIAYFSEESGEYVLHLRDQNGMGDVRKISLGTPPSFYYSPTWSPDGKKIAYSDKRLNLWYVDLEKGSAPTRVDTNPYEWMGTAFSPQWSPDSRWLAYTRELKNHLAAVFVHELATGKNHQLTDGMSDARFPQFDRGGKYLYFAASTDIGPAVSGFFMSSTDRPVSRSVYLIVLPKDLSSPLAPESDEEKEPEAGKSGESAKSDGADAGKEKKEPQEPVTVRIDVENIGQRILALPIPARNYVGLASAKKDILFLLESAPVPGFGASGMTLHKFDLSKRKLEKYLDGLNSFDLSYNGEKMLYRQGERWVIAKTEAAPKPDEGALKLEGMEVWVDPRAEWRQMYHEVWRIERDFLYDPGAHGLDLKAAEKRYAPYLEGIASREDLNTLFREMLGELTLGHVFVWGGDQPQVKRVRGGLLGADYRVENGRYRFARVYNGENWNPELRAPLTQPGVNVRGGEYLLTVSGRELRATDNLYRYFEGTSGKSVVLRVGPNADGTGSREVTVVPVEDEWSLRHLAWIEENRRKVDQMSGGRVAYVYLPNTARQGYQSFNRYFFAQVDREGAVIDERFNGGGQIADYIIDAMRRPLMNYWATREGEDFPAPVGAIFGPKAMIINEMAGSGGDLMPWYFRKAGLGPLIGKRTWGGLVGIGGYPQLIDGGFVTAPRVAFWSPKGEWDVENHGVDPDIEVEFDPQAWRAGRDPQLERAVAEVMEELRRNPLPRPKRPAYPNYHTAGRQQPSAARR
jgi:tricorn protease